MFSSEERRKKKIYRERLNEFKEEFSKIMLDPSMSNPIIGQNPTASFSWNTLDLWATAIMMDEAKTLSRLTRWLIVLSTVLSVLTFILAYPLISGVLAGLK